MNRLFILIMLAGTLFSAISQILLKLSADKTYSHPIYEYLNPQVICAYGIFFGVLLLNTYAYTQIPYRYGPIIDTFTYVFVLLLSAVVLKEKITKGQLIGNCIIIAGIIIYAL